MSENVQNLSQKIANALEFGSDVEIPSYITQNLNKDLREYQITALKHFYLQRKKPATNHLMFNMATGSGKTLIMAALMLECYKQGYRNFIFFVNSTAILEKTKANFCDSKSEKYLFKDKININTQSVEINAVSNLAECKEGAINVYFSTVQGLYSLFTNERENAFTLDDLKGRKFVFLADEAHHLNAETKKGTKIKSELENKENWESVVNNAFMANDENLMLEFTATIPKEKEVQDKYKDKIIYEYALKEFCQNGFSKRIYLLKYDDYDIKARFLGGVLASLYRQLLALKHKISLKPVLLFKSERKEISKQNEKDFLNFISNLRSEDIEKFYENALTTQIKGELLSDSLNFFENEFGEHYSLKLKEYIRANFNELFVLNVNDDEEAKNYQFLLNDLESTKNNVRVIFAVNKLNEGWDVLNLFDIVRLKNTKAQDLPKDTKINKSTTTSEVQLIGRGARYYPFLENDFEEELKYKRKFDKDLSNELAYLERLSYHTLNEVSFIKDLNEQMKEQGLFVENDLIKKKYELNLSEYAKKMKAQYKLFYAKNKREKRLDSNIKIDKTEMQEMQRELELIKIPLFSKSINENEVNFKEESKNSSLSQNSKHIRIKENLSYEIFLKAFYKKGYDFSILQNFEKARSKREFFDSFLSKLNLDIHKNQKLSRENQLEIFSYILEHFKRIMNKKKQEFKVSEFKAYELNLNERVVFVGQDNDGNDKIKLDSYEWLYFDKVPYDSNLELDFLDFIESEKECLNKKFSEWIVVRNDGFNEFKIYDNREGEVSYGMGFEPDFILFAKSKKSDKIFALQCFIEAKGEHLAGNEQYIGKDKWKESFLQSISGTKFDKIINEKALEKIDLSKNNESFTIQSLPFFISKKQFKEHFDEFIKD